MGDRDACARAFDSAAHVTRLELVNNRVAAYPLEPTTVLADYHPGDGYYTLYTPSQGVFSLRETLAKDVLRVPEGALRSGAVSLIFVLFSFSGWNAAAYIAGEMRQPHKTIPVSLLAGTGVVALLYLGLNVVFLYGLGVSGMSGVLQVGEKASLALFGPVATHLVSAFMALSILASVSAMILVAPRVYYAMASDKLFPMRLARVHPRFQTPAASIVCLALWTSVLVLSGTFEQLIVYAGFALVFFSALAVAAVIVLRVRRPQLVRPFRVPLYPFVPLLFLAFAAWILIFTFRGQPTESLLGIATVLLGLPLYFYWRRKLS